MAFNIANLQKLAGGGIVGATPQRMNVWAYHTADAWATVAGAGYFADAVAPKLFSEHDVIVVVSSDEYHIARLVNTTSISAIDVADWDMTAA